MDTTIIFTLVLSVLFLGSIAWIVIHSRRQQSASARAQQTATPDGKDARRPRAPGGEKND